MNSCSACAVWKLDSVDMLILDNLQKNGRITNVDLARIAGISAPPCLRRLRLMEERGVVRGYHADVSLEVMGFDIRALCLLSLASQSPEAVSAFSAAIAAVTSVRACFSTSGNENFILYIVARDLRDYDDVLRQVQSCGVVGSVKSYVLNNTYKNEPGIPIDTSDGLVVGKKDRKSEAPPS
ncbi:MAG: Lrp/AsnC family transcriptional regulator [Alphaproteobacteria bacterium]|nr:Lrp/AsnC family transcriptional regulator [Alphaproteobacteria bacterium]